MDSSWLAVLLDALTHLEDHFGEGARERGRHYADDGSLDDLRVTELDDGYLSVEAAAFGSAPWPYDVELVAVGDGGGGASITSDCTCPVGTDCKHGAAIAWLLPQLLRERFGVSAASAPSGFGGLLDDLASLVPHDGAAVGLGLEFSLGPLRRAPRSRFGVADPGPDERLRLRPMRPGARGGWVRSGIAWHQLGSTAVAGDVDRAQLRALTRLRSALQAHGGLVVGEPGLESFGPDVVALLHSAAAAGVTLLTGAGVDSVRVWPESVGLRADARAVDGGCEVTVGLDLDGRLVHGPGVTTYGRPAHTVTFVDDGVVSVVALDPHLDAGPGRALARGGAVRLPDGAEAVDALRRLARAVPVGSSDDSVEVPDRVPPRLRVRIGWHGAAEADVDWEWVYGDHSVPLDGPTPAEVDRDRHAERALLADVVPAPEASHRHVAGADTLHLALLELPAWRAVAGLEVVETDAPHFREAEEAPQISFEAATPDDGTSPSNTDTAADPAADPATEAAGDQGPVDWLDLQVVITIEGEPIPLAAVVEALTLESPHLLLPSGLYVSTDRPEFTRLHDVVRAAGLLRDRPARRSASDLPDAPARLRIATDDLGLLADLADLGEVDPVAADWVGRAQALRDLVTLPTPEPCGVASTLRPYQLDGFHWLSFLHQHGLGGILADDMGLGKTLQVLSLIARARSLDPQSPPFLVVAPTSVVSNWAREAARHTPGLTVSAVAASGARRAESIADLARGADVVVTSYTLLRLESDAYAALAWGGLVLDEAQQVKNHQSKAHAAVRAISAPFRLAVTGTPFENRLLELWSLLAIVAPGLYPQARTFTDHVVRPVEKEGDAAALRRFTRRIKPFVLRRTKDLVAADLPPKQEQVLSVELTPGHRRLYDTHLAKERQRILGLVDDDFDRNRVAILAALTTLRQLSLDPAVIDPDRDHLGSAKLDLLVDHLRDIAAEGHRALVFSSFTGFLSRVRSRLEREGIGAVYLDGATRDRAGVVEEFRTASAPAFLISLKAGGVGLTLTEADYVFVLDPWWNPAAEAQAVDRAHRIGQQRTVMVYRLVSTGTIEEKVMELKNRKAALFAQVVDGEAGLSGSVTAADIRDLFG